MLKHGSVIDNSIVRANDGYIYFIGGVNNNSSKNSLITKIPSNMFNYKSHLDGPIEDEVVYTFDSTLFHATSVVYMNYIIIAGGIYNEKLSDTIYIFDILTNELIVNKYTLPITGANVKLLIYEDKLTENAYIYCYNQFTDIVDNNIYRALFISKGKVALTGFSIITRLPQYLKYTNMFLYNGRIYVISGRNIDGFISNKSYVYNIDFNYWYEIQNPGINVSNAYIDVIFDKLYIFGGITSIDNREPSSVLKNLTISNMSHCYQIKENELIHLSTRNRLPQPLYNINGCFGDIGFTFFSGYNRCNNPVSFVYII